MGKGRTREEQNFASHGPDVAELSFREKQEGFFTLEKKTYVYMGEPYVALQILS